MANVLWNSPEALKAQVQSFVNDLHIIDNDPVRLAARTLVERLRSEEYKGETFFDGYGPVLDYDEAVDAVMEFLSRHHQCSMGVK